MIPDKEYLFSSSFLRAGEGVGNVSTRMAQMLEAASAGQLYQIVSELFRVSVPTEEKMVFDAAMDEAVEKVRSAVPSFAVYYPLLYKYDCTNIKIAIKCAVQEIHSYNGFYTCGTVPAQQMQEYLQRDTLPNLPPAMTAAVRTARQEYSKTGEARCIDLLLDRACFADMAEKAAAMGVPLIGQIVCMRADFANILACLRIRFGGLSMEAGRSLLSRVFVPGGQIALSVLFGEEGILASVEQIGERIGDYYVKDAVRSAVSAADLSSIEKIFDEAVLLACQPYRFKPFGPEVAVRYLLIREAELTNARIIAAGLESGARADTIRERLREVNV
ncbi:MAG: V-type ATPase subunit [Clostridiales bacterium]|jgi:V/A-type H+-transporting ATPase subunit C|nr:V-type ATPase subunit [Clostridiales bacterium]